MTGLAFIVAALLIFAGGIVVGSWGVVTPFWMGVVWFMLKVLVIIFLMMWFRWTFPRLRVDQLLTLEWKYLLPLNLMNIVLMAVIIWLNWTI